MATRTRINAAHIIATQNNEHRHLRDGVVVFEGDRIIHVGKSFDGKADQTIDAPHGVVTPGFINTHAHLAGSPLDKSFIEDRGPRQFYGSGLFEYPAGPRWRAGCRGGRRLPRLLDGRAAPHRHDDDHGDRSPRARGGRAGKQGRDARSTWASAIARALADDRRQARVVGVGRAGRARRHGPGGRVHRASTTASPTAGSRASSRPMQIDTCTEELLRASRKRRPTRCACRSRSTPAQSVNEFNEIVAPARPQRRSSGWRTSTSSDSNVILGHAIILAGG